MKSKLTLVICSCDKYSDIWNAQVSLLNENWSERCIDTIIVTDSFSSRNFDEVTVFSAGDNIEFSERLNKCLELVSTEYVLLILDDYFLNEKIQSSKIEFLLSVMDSEHVDYIRMYRRPIAKKCDHLIDKKLYCINLEHNYAINLYPGIWRTSFLKKTYTKPLSAWEYEVSLTEIAKSLNAHCLVSKRNDFPILNGIVQGKFFRKAYKYIINRKLYTGSRLVLSRRDTILYFFKLHLSLLVPKKLKKSIKNYLRRIGYRFYSE